MTDKENQDCQGFYEVSGYTTDDGKKVDSYTRRCWKHGGGATVSGVQNTQDNIEKTNDKLDEINNKNDILDNIEKTMSIVDKTEKIQDKKWKTVNTTDEGYSSILSNYAKSKETINKINKNLRYLNEAVINSWGIAKSYINDLKSISSERLNGTPTGYIENPISVKMTSILNKSSNNYLSDIDNIIKTNLSEFVIDYIFNLSNSVPIYDLNSYWGQVFWLYSKGQIDIKSIPNNKNKIKEYNSVDDIKNIKLKKFVTKKIEKEMGINNCKGLVFFSNSDLAKKFTESKDLQNYIKDYHNGKADNSIHFDIKNGIDYFSTLGYAEVYNVEKLSNGDYEIVLVDTYDFNKDSNFINKIGYKLQKEKISKPFFSIIYIHIDKNLLYKIIN